MSKQMLLLEACCPNCQALLTEGQRVHLDAYLRDTHQEGAVYLSAIFGDYRVDSDLAIPDGALVDFRCPACEASLMLETPCKLCGAPLASVTLRSGGTLDFCSRRGCRGHALGGFGDVDQMMALINSMMSTPHD